MRKNSFAKWPCSIARTMHVLGDPWAILVIREALYGIRRFDDFQVSLGIARNTLTERLSRLVAEGVLEKHLYQTNPRRYEYQLTEKGAELFGVLGAISQWGDRWLAGGEGPPVIFHHESCDHDTHAEVVCANCHEPLELEDCSVRLGPGYPAELAQRSDVRQRFGLDESP
ncbi:winged helix-turn-helix transcriptional regulator [Mycobacterium saskatchewanense]|uniref:HxlR family transcriptional regulator n=1 Tax=Mycobacterium saskatchewanense TaxID=220927 RepID=A0AAJ3NU29_9MYCO|nr:helix-turn-helix domain-containing protein [Mycobacterium saskatchewanense]ORW74918.1 HxlR family transcriptional regulator [Mycobacterium saskatchewanense]